MEALHVLLIAASPVIELRGAIPFALTAYSFPIEQAFLLSVVGNIIPPLLLIPFFGTVNDFLSRHSPRYQQFSLNYLARVRINHQQKIETWKSFGLLLLVAIPLPLTGAWTASLAAHIFGIPFRKAIPIIFLGLLIAGVIVSFITVGAIRTFGS
jgi:uncharacterized membrane protein